MPASYCWSTTAQSIGTNGPTRSRYSQLRLDPLAGADAAAMLAALLGEGVELNPLKRLIAERTGGNPFFIEEFVQALFDEGALTRNGAVKLAALALAVRSADDSARHAGRAHRSAANRAEATTTNAAVIGRESSLSLISQLAGSRMRNCSRCWRNLQSGRVHLRAAGLPADEYVFKHALTQEVAYNSLLIERRKLLHERAGQALEVDLRRSARRSSDSTGASL